MITFPRFEVYSHDYSDISLSSGFSASRLPGPGWKFLGRWLIWS